MRVGADGHAAPAVRADLGPIGEALFGINLPAQGVIGILGSLASRDSVGGTDLHAFLTAIAKINHRRVECGLVDVQRQVGCDHCQAHPWAKVRGHQ